MSSRTNAELTEATASGLRWITLGRIVTELTLVASMVVLARLIPPSAFGMFAVAVIVQELAVGVPSEGVGNPIVQRTNVERAHLEGGLAVALLVGAILAAATLLAAAFVVRPIFGGETAFLVALTTPWFLFGAVLAIPMALLRRRLDFRRLSLLVLLQSIVRSITAVLLAAVAGMDAEALVLSGLAGMGAMVLLALGFAPAPFPRWRWSAVRELLPYGGPAALASFSWVGFRNGDYAIVGAQLGAAQAGFYWRGFQLAVEYQRKVSTLMSQVAFPVLARTAGPDEMFALRERMVRLLTVVLFPVLASLVVLAPTLVPAVFGPAWEPAVLPTQILAGAGAASVVIDAVGTVLMATGRGRALLGYGVAHFVVYVSAILVASPHGLAAVSAASVVVHSIFLVVAYQVLLRGRTERTLGFLWHDISAATVSCVALVAVAWPVAVGLREAGVPAFLEMAAVVPAGAVAYLVALRVWFPPAFSDLAALLRRVLPARTSRTALARVPLEPERSTS